MRPCKGFTFIELIISIAVLSILVVIAVPNFNSFITQMRVDNEISALYRLLLVTRNASINSGQRAIACPLNINAECTTKWHEEISVFIDVNNNNIFNAGDESIIKVKPAIKLNDQLIYGQGRNKIIYQPTGHLSGLSNGTFRYCPKMYPEKSRGIIISISGRLYMSSDLDHDGKDEKRNKKEITCP